MLLELHVKNLALIEQADIEFGEGLNILTGETGTGKSVIIGSVNMALGGKVWKDMIRSGADYAYVELIFQILEPDKLEALRALEVPVEEDGVLVISKKIMPTRSISKVNDETVTAGSLRKITGLLIDIHGQHEHQSLLYKSKHLEILDEYIRSNTKPLKQKIADAFHTFGQLTKQLKNYSMDEESRKRELDFCSFEIDEIERGELMEGEEDELSSRYRKFTHGQKITAALSAAHHILENEELGRALKEVQGVIQYDEALESIRDQLYDADSILNDAGREISYYIEEMDFDEEAFRKIEERLNLIHNLQAKYGNTTEQILKSLDEKKKYLKELENQDILKQTTQKKLLEIENVLKGLCQQLSDQRKAAAEKLTEKIKAALLELNFLDVNCAMKFERLDHYTAEGFDEVEFMISTNPGEPVKSLAMVASGGELSRIMLAVKAVLADSDDIPTLIFDEIDTGISGRTAQKVSEKLFYIAKSHQVICITHLPQIASMADCHFEIAKITDGERTKTTIQKLSKEESVEELARLLGGTVITETVRKHAREMKELAKNQK